MSKPLDHPSPERPRRIYFALTNHCNRACPWCSTCSSPRGNSWMNLEDYTRAFPQSSPFQVQLEGGEPTIHPDFWEFVRIARANPNCTHLVLCTNGVVLPRDKSELRRWVEKLGVPLTIKLSANHYLLDHDGGLIQLARNLRDIFAESPEERLLVINVRLRSGYENDDKAVRDQIESAGLLPHSNIFYLQRYGFASNEEKWNPPKPVWDNFELVNPDGRRFGSDLIARSEGMRRLQ
jgi:MoaA/NifB/PqqE/SkfB family radical SAM enzyme